MPLASENHLHLKEKRWFAVYTNYKREKRVTQMLQAKGVDVYLPLQKLLRQWERKKKIVELPLISCYVFVKINQSEYNKVLETENVLNFVRFRKNLIAIPEREIDIIKRMLGENLEINLEEVGLKTGEEVEIAWKSLTGVRGTLIEIRGKKEVIVELKQLGYGLRISVPQQAILKVSMPV